MPRFSTTKIIRRSSVARIRRNAFRICIIMCVFGLLVDAAPVIPHLATPTKTSSVGVRKLRSKRSSSSSSSSSNCMQQCSSNYMICAKHCQQSSLVTSSQRNMFNLDECVHQCLEEMSTTQQQLSVKKSAWSAPRLNDESSQRSPPPPEEEDILEYRFPPQQQHIEQAPPPRSIQMSAKQRCQMEGFDDSPVCEMEYENPEDADRVYRVLLPQLASKFEQEMRQLMITSGTETAAAGRDVSSDDYRSPGEDEDRITGSAAEDPVRGERKRGGRKIRSADRFYDNSAADAAVEVCPSVTQVVMPDHAQYAKTKKRVELYFNRRNDYFQYFHIGYCKYPEPQLQVVVDQDHKTKCVTIDGNFMAEYIMKNEDLDKSKPGDHICERANDKVSVCRGWIRLHSNCKHFTRSKT